jgi:hypothetical protein
MSERDQGLIVRSRPAVSISITSQCQYGSPALSDDFEKLKGSVACQAADLAWLISCQRYWKDEYCRPGATLAPPNKCSRWYVAITIRKRKSERVLLSDFTIACVAFIVGDGDLRST